MSFLSDGRGVYSSQLRAVTLGEWSARHYLHGTWLEEMFSNPYATYTPLYYTWSTATVSSMVDTGPAIIEGSETISDSGDGQSRTGKIQLRVYTPRAFPVVLETRDCTGPWLPASNWKRVNTWETQPVTLTMTNGVVDTVTRTTTYGINAELSGKFREIYSGKIAGSLQYAEGESAAISTTISDSRQFLPDKAITYEYRFVRAKTWRERRGFGLRFTSNGYGGLEDFIQVDFTSGSKQAAEIGDYIEQVERRVAAP
jgi:hypothetical protein